MQIGNPEDIERQVPGLTVVSQEGKTVTVLFATTIGLEEFRGRLEELEGGGKPKYQQLLWNVSEVGTWGAEDRRGRALVAEGIPDEPKLVLDVELWALDRVPERAKMVRGFGEWCDANNIAILDRLAGVATVVLARVEATRAGLDLLLEHRDVRLVDLPPRFGFNFELLGTPLSDLGQVPPPREDAPLVAVLDSGIVSNHPLLGPAVADAQSFTHRGVAQDENGHGTHVAGLALYGDVEMCASGSKFVPRLRLLSGRVTDVGASDRADSELLENRLKRAVAGFVKDYGCRVFNLSICDERRPYTGGHVDRLASVLDEFARTYDVLFVVPTGNFSGLKDGTRWKSDYPTYLGTDEARLLDPAPALNVLTVGSIARHEKSRMAQRYPKDPSYTPIARRGEPSPFSRTGPGPGGAIKPELVEYGGNRWVDRSSETELRNARDLGELSLNRQFAGGNLFALESGTSQAAPKVAHAAARLLGKFPDASPNLLRALLVAHAEVPVAARELLATSPELLRSAVGYGRPDIERAMFSTQRRVTLVAHSQLEDDTCHFYEIPVPPDFLAGPARRQRRITVVLSHMPEVRRTRFDYRSSRMEFRFVRGTSMDDVAGIFKKQDRDDSSKMPSEPNGVTPSISLRKAGTVQRASWTIKATNKTWKTRPPFIVVTSRPPVWGRVDGQLEDYALVIVIEDLSDQQVQLHGQIRTILRQRQRGRLRTR